MMFLYHKCCFIHNCADRGTKKMNNFSPSSAVSGKLPMPLWEDLRLYSNNLCAGYVTFYYRLTAAERRSAPASLSKLLKAGLRVHL